MSAPAEDVKGPVADAALAAAAVLETYLDPRFYEHPRLPGIFIQAASSIIVEVTPDAESAKRALSGVHTAYALLSGEPPDAGVVAAPGRVKNFLFALVAAVDARLACRRP